MTNTTVKRPPLSAMMDVGIDVLKRLGLTAEGTMHGTLEEMAPFADVLISGHAPSRKDGLRLNIAATDDDYRAVSIKEHLDYIDMVRQFPGLKQVNIHFGPRMWVEVVQTRGREGDYSRLIDAIGQIADYAAKGDQEIVLENHARYWDGLADNATGDQVDWSRRNAYFGTSPEEWMGICQDVDRPNVGLCLDSSHATTYVHTFPESERANALMSFLARPELIRHVHWSDNFPFDVRGRNDSHAVIGKGALPVEFHRAIKGLDATLLLENIPATQEMEEQLEVIAGL